MTSGMPDDPVARTRQQALDQLALGLERLAEGQRNLAAQQALLDRRLLRVERNRLFTAVNRVASAGANLARRLANGWPARLTRGDDDPAAYARWVAHDLAGLPSTDAARAASNAWAHRPGFSLVMTIRNAEAAAGCLESIRAQAYENWELCGAAHPACESCLAGFPRVRAAPAGGLDDAQALNAAAHLATGEYLAFLDESGVLSPLALHYVAEALQQGAFDVLYSDEDGLDSGRRRVRPLFKPDWSPELLTSAMYLGHPLIVRRERFIEAGGLSPRCVGAHLYDLALRLADGPVRVHHIPRILYHRSERPPAEPPPDAAAQAIARAILRRERIEAACVPAPAAGAWIVRRKRAAGGMTAIVCSKSADLLDTCLQSLRATAGGAVRQIVVVAHEDPGPNPALRAVIQRAEAVALSFTGAFHFAAMNNLGAGRAQEPNLLFLNDDVRATQRGWAEMLAEQVSREEVGVAGAVLRYPTGALQHAGVVVGIGDGVGHAGRHMRASRLWPWLLAARDVSAVTGACLAIRRDLFAQLGGFDTLFPNNYNDVDLCFRARARGYRVVCVPAGGLIHAECQSRPGVVRFEERYRFYQRWADLLRRPDPYYSPSLAPTERIGLNLEGDDWYRRLLGDGQPQIPARPPV